MNTFLAICAFIFISVPGFAQDVASGAALGPEVAGFQIVNQAPTNISPSDIQMLIGRLSLYNVRFPNLVAKVRLNGFNKIVIRPKQDGEGGGTVLAAVSTNPKEIIIYESYFSTGKDNEIFKSLDYSVADIALLHELIHAFDIDNKILQNNLQVVGWGLSQDLSLDSFRII